MHWTQRERLKNIDRIRDWLKEVKIEEVDMDALERKASLVFGCTKTKAREYIKTIVGEYKD